MSRILRLSQEPCFKGIAADLEELNVTEELAVTMGKECFGSSMSGNPIQLSAELWGDLFKRLM